MILGIGVFDGIHRGHQRITDQCDMIMTFLPHPRTVLTGKPVKRLTTWQEMQHLYPKSMAVDFHCVMTKTPVEFFTDSILPFNPTTLCIGEDFRFGHNRAGNSDTLAQLGKAHDIQVIAVPLLHDTGQPIKSGRIRGLLESGAAHFNEAIALLGHPYSLSGRVIRGDQRGSELGFPTANILLPADKLALPAGVYRGYVPDLKKQALIYSGTAPTLRPDRPLYTEVHILDYKDDLYDQFLLVEINEFLRHEEKFETPDALQAQLNQDKDRVVSDITL